MVPDEQFNADTECTRFQSIVIPYCFDIGNIYSGDHSLNKRTTFAEQETCM